MGKLKDLIIDLENKDTEFVMKHYGLFLEKAMKDRQMPSSWSDAINAIHWAAYLSGTKLVRIQIEYILRQQTESLYEGD
tara:strand:- start:36 stop:272 length:237 start_codon:yes stop_codon:yes gene_type:complete